MIVDGSEVQRLQTEAAGILLGIVGDGGFTSGELFWSELAGSSTATLTVMDAAGSARQVKTPFALFDKLGDLRSAMAETAKGTWFAVIVRVSPAGDCTFDFTYDRRPYWASPTYFEPTSRDAADPDPSDQAFLEDLEDYPRSAEFLPSWHPAASPAPAPWSAPETAAELGGPTSLDGVSLFPASLAALASNADWLQIAGALRRQLSAALAEGLQSDQAVSSAYNRVFDLFIAPGTAAVVKQLWMPGHAAAGYPPKSTDIPDDEPVSDPSRALEVLLEDVSDVMTTIAEHQLATAG